VSHLVIRGDARRIPLADGSVHLIACSPPYWQQRSYRDAGAHFDGQIGSEPHPRHWLEAMFEVMKECWRVLDDKGSIFVNLGDKRAGSGGHNNAGVSDKSTLKHDGRANPQPVTERELKLRSMRGAGSVKATRRNAPDRYEQAHFGRRKSRQLLPERFAIGCEDGLADPEGIGWIVRQVIVWQKANGLPESVQDRTRDDFEYIYHLTKSERYFAAIDEIREPSQIVFDAPQDGTEYHQRALAAGEGHHRYDMRTNNPLGKVPGSVWRIASEPLRIPDCAKERYNLPDHFACLDADTEILTRRGWLRHTALEVGDQVAGYNLDTGLAEWTGCHAVHRYDYDGPMVSVEKRDLSMRLTPNHRCLASRMTGPIHARGPLEVVMAEDLTPRHFIPRSVEFAPEPATKAIGENMAALCGWVAAEGWYASDLVYLSQSQTANPEKVAAIDALLERFEWRLSDRGYRRSFRSSLGFIERHEGTRVYRGRPWTDVTWRLPLWLGHEVQRLMPAKFLTCELANLPAEEARALLDAFVDGDGHRRPDERLGIFQKERGNLDWLQMIAVRLGYKTTLRRGSDKWVLYLTPGGRSVTLRGTNGVNKPVPREHYRGVVWCPTTGTGTFVARRNGSVFVTGNSFPTEIPRRLILGFSPNGICTACNEPRRPVVDRKYVEMHKQSRNRAARQDISDDGFRSEGSMNGREVSTIGRTEATITGYACRCTPKTSHRGKRGDWKAGREESAEHGNAFGAGSGNAVPRRPGGFGTKIPPPELPMTEYHLAGWTPPPTRPSIVLDVFGGTGTTALVAETLGRIGMTLDLSADYCNLARWRIEESGHGAKAEQRTWKDAQGTLL
jgi:DNA modification methylase